VEASSVSLDAVPVSLQGLSAIMLFAAKKNIFLGIHLLVFVEDTKCRGFSEDFMQ
jgi:hypothetical protein